MPLEPGQKLSHYRLVEKIGEGGMGVVWKARDEKLRRDVALKVLPADLVEDPERRRRLLHEARSAAAINHPNIGTVHEVDEAEGTVFIAMELVEGKTLRLLLRGKPLAIPVALRTATEMAEGLAAAHQANVIHRDLKPENVLVRPDGHVKILDFGLAKVLLEQEELSRSKLSKAETLTEELTREGRVLGTATYMSPEQAKGEALDARTDIFSFGSMLYEMAAGRAPFQGKSATEVLSAILRDRPAAPSAQNNEVPSELDRIVGKCLEKEPRDRYQHADELAVDLRKLRRAVETGAPEAATPSGGVVAPMTSAQTATHATIPARRNRWLWPSVAGVAAVALVATALTVMRGRSIPTDEEASSALPAPNVHLRRSVAVLGFKNLAARDDKAWLSTALSEMLTTELSAGGELRTVPGETIAQMKRNLSLSEGDTYSPETLGKIRGQLGSDFVVLGSFLTLGEASGGQIRLDLRLQDTAAGETVASLSETGTEADLLGLVTRAGTRLREELGTAATTAEQREALRATVPADPEAARAYTEGLAALRQQNDAKGARERLEVAAEIEPDHPMIRMALSEAWSSLGYDTRALANAERAFQHSGSLPEAHRRAVEGRYREVQHDWDRAIEVYRAAWESAPDDLDAGLRLVRVQGVNREEDALATIATLRRLPPPQGNDPRLDLQESFAARDLGRMEQALEGARRATARGEVLEAPLFRAAGLGWEAWILDLMGKKAEAQSAAEASLAIYEEIGHRSERGFALDTLAGILIDPREAIPLYEESLAIAREIDSPAQEGVALNNMANRLGELGDLERQKEMYERSLVLYEQIDNKQDYAIILNNLGLNCVFRGEWDEAERYFQQALSTIREQGARGSEAVTLGVLGAKRVGEARLTEAREHLEEARRIQIETGARQFLPFSIQFLGWIEFLEDRPGRARELMEEALTIVNEMGLPGAGVRNSLADVELEEGRPEQAESLARRAREAAMDPFAAHEATSLLARALADQGRGVETETEIRAALEGIRDSQNVLERIIVAINVAKAEIALGKLNEARRRLEAIRKETSGIGWVVPEMESRLLLARLGREPGDTVADRAVLKAVEEDARAVGLTRFARLAAEAATWNR